MKLMLELKDDVQFRKNIQDIVHEAVRGEIRSNIHSIIDEELAKIFTDAKKKNMGESVVEKYEGYTDRIIKDNINKAVETVIREEIDTYLNRISLNDKFDEIFERLLIRRGIKFSFPLDPSDSMRVHYVNKDKLIQEK